MATLDPRTTALVLIDLQAGIVSMDLAPRTGDAVVATAKDLAARFRAARAPVVAVHVAFGAADAPPMNVDKPSLPASGTPAGFEAYVDGLVHPGDVQVLKHQWGAFTGTDLDLKLRRRGVRTIVLAGIATNMGVESTARAAWELGYDVVLVEDCCTSISAEGHRFAFDAILPMIARVTAAADVTLA